MSGKCRILNVGIGAGAWDAFLLARLPPRGALTSLDIDAPICRRLRDRLRRAEGRGRVRVLRRDILAGPVPGAPFDVVTATGSTVQETGDYAAALAACLRQMAPRGRLFYMDLHRLHRPSRFRRFCRGTAARIERFREFRTTRVPFYAYLARRAD